MEVVDGISPCQTTPPVTLSQPVPPPSVSKNNRRLRPFILVTLGVWAVAAYLLLPWWWRMRVRRHPALYNAPTITHTHNGIPGDPLNLALIGPEDAVVSAMHAAGWSPADAITMKSSLRIIGSTLFDKPYKDAPVSNLFLFGRKQDFAFEQMVGGSPDQRHHVRFWRAPIDDHLHRPLWLGAATFDTRVGLSRTTGQVTHHVGPNVDAERDLIVSDLRSASALQEEFWIEDFQIKLSGKNGGGDPWRTDGRLAVATLKSPHR